MPDLRRTNWAAVASLRTDRFWPALLRLAESKLVPEWINDGHRRPTRRVSVNARPKLARSTPRYVRSVVVEVASRHPNNGPRCAVPVVLAEPQRGITATDSEEGRQTRFELVLEVDREAQNVDVERAGKVYVWP